MGSSNGKVPAKPKKKVVIKSAAPATKKPATKKPSGGVPRKQSTPRETGGRKLSKRSTGVRRG